MSVAPAHCAAIVTTDVSCRAALTAGMHSISVPDALTAFQDFGGSDYVVGGLDEVSMDRVYALLEPR
jgi:beta-phosphoglucomutase-like phosphatase (HAD superfamily)